MTSPLDAMLAGALGGGGAASAREGPRLGPAEAAALRDELQRDLCSSRLRHFVRAGWPILEPGTAYVHGRVVDAICEHMEAVVDGEINRLLVNVPPGIAKSLISSVFTPAWAWGPRGKPHLRFLGFSYSDRLAVRDARRTKLLVESGWYQRLWPVKLAVDQNAKTKFETRERGWRMASSTGGVATGERADVLVVDDPHAIGDGDSPSKLETTLLWWRETLPTRLNDPARSAIVVIMQRVAENDVAGDIIARDQGWTLLRLPMEYEPDRHCVTLGGRFEDWRRRPGQLLFPERFPRDTVEALKAQLGSFATAAQLQQAPAPRGGTMIHVDKMPVVDDFPRDVRLCRAWDLAGTEARAGADPDYTAGALVGYRDGRTWVVDMVQERLSALGVEQKVAATAHLDRARFGGEVAYLVKQDPGAAGKSVVDRYLTEVLAGFEAHAQRDTGSKVERARNFAAASEAGNVALVRGPWNDAFLAEARVFPRGKHDDQVDAACSARDFLTSESPFWIG